MKTARYYGIEDIRCEEQPLPDCGEEDVLIKVAYAGICGSDLHIYKKGMFIQNIPETMGHEFSGTVVKTGRKVHSLQAGDRVTANPMVTCGTCIACRTGRRGSCETLGFIGEVRPGCFAEYIALPQEDVIQAPPDIDLKLLALAEPLAVALNICEQAKPEPTDNILIIGPGRSSHRTGIKKRLRRGKPDDPGQIPSETFHRGNAGHENSDTAGR